MHCAAQSLRCLDAMIIGLSGLAVITELTVSANLLTWAGIPYVTDGGVPLIKLHPGTDLIALAFLLRLCRCSPWRLAVSSPLAAAFVGAILFCILYAGVMTGAGNLIVLFDSFLPAGLLALILPQGTERGINRLRCAMSAAFAVNAALGLAESIARTNVIPLYLNDADYHPRSEDFRPTALYDHPLTGGVMTMLGLALSPTRSCLRLPYLVLMWAALVAFGGRMAVGMSAIAASCLPASRMLRRILLRDAGPSSGLLVIAAILPAGVAIAVILFSTGISERLVGHLYWDPSAQARLAQWDILGRLDACQLTFGVPRRDLLAALNGVRLSTGVAVVENFWLLMFVTLGAACFIIFAAGMLSFLASLYRPASAAGRLLILAVIAVASSSNSLGRKSTVLVGLVATIACMPGCRTRYLRADDPALGAAQAARP